MGHDIVIVADEPWENFTWRRRHHVAWALARDHKVLFVEPPLNVLSPLRHRNIQWERLFNLGRLKHQGRNLYSYSPFKIVPLSLPFSGRLKFDAVNKKIVFSCLKRFANRLDLNRPILWVFFSDKQYEYYGLLDEAIVVGDIYDKIAPSWEGMLPEHVLELQGLQDRIIRKADIVFTVSRLLLDELAPLHDKVYLVPNGVDYDSFNNAAQAGLDMSFRKPVIGFLGMMHYIVDFDLLNFIAQSRPEWTLLLMGKENISGAVDRLSFETLIKRHNVVYAGELYRCAIPAYLRITDVCMMPMKRIELRRYANPLKMWEYLAAGKPIVGTEQGSDYGLGEFIETARNKHEFLGAVEKSLGSADDVKLVNKRKEVARQNSWAERTGRMLKIIEQNLGKGS